MTTYAKRKMIKTDDALLRSGGKPNQTTTLRTMIKAFIHNGVTTMYSSISHGRNTMKDINAVTFAEMLQRLNRDRRLKTVFRKNINIVMASKIAKSEIVSYIRTPNTGTHSTVLLELMFKDWTI